MIAVWIAVAELSQPVPSRIRPVAASSSNNAPTPHPISSARAPAGTNATSGSKGLIDARHVASSRCGKAASRYSSRKNGRRSRGARLAGVADRCSRSPIRFLFNGYSRAGRAEREALDQLGIAGHPLALLLRPRSPQEGKFERLELAHNDVDGDEQSAGRHRPAMYPKLGQIRQQPGSRDDNERI